MMHEVVLASSNQGKLKEIQSLLAGQNLIVRPQSELNIPDAIEDGLTFVENAIIKARHACKLSGRPSLSDDSGIEVDYLNGQPGIYSARYAGEPSDNALNNEKLLAELSGVEQAQRTARFQCIIVYMQHELDPTPIICQGTWEGLIAEKLSGKQGFGYDPLFIVPEHQCTSAELPADIKNKISHRGQALAKLVKALQYKQDTFTHA